MKINILISIDQAKSKIFFEKNPFITINEIIGFDGRRISAAEYFKLCVNKNKVKLTPAEYGCSISHKIAYKKFLDEYESAVMSIYEDDVTIKNYDKIKKLEEFLSENKKETPILIRFGGQNRLKSSNYIWGKKIRINGVNVIEVDKRCYGSLWRTCGYSLNRAAAQRIYSFQNDFETTYADDFAKFFEDSGIIYLTNVVDHPEDMTSSIIETERQLKAKLNIYKRASKKMFNFLLLIYLRMKSKIRYEQN